MEEKIIIFTEFEKKFRSNSIGPLSFEISKGEMVGILGSSGSGKTVVINSLIGATKKFKGEILIEDISRKSGHAVKLNAKIGVYEQMDFGLETLSCYDYLKNFCTYSGVDKIYIDELIDFWLSFFELSDHKDKKIKNFSWGMKNRVNLILCFIKNPEIIIMDEPGANLDSRWRSKIYNLLKYYKDNGKTIIITSHNIDEVVDLIDYFVVLDTGKKIFEGTSRELNLYNKYKLFLSEPFDVKKFREFTKQKNIKSFKYDSKENSIVFATSKLKEINWIFLYFINEVNPILNLIKLPINIDSIHKALE